MLYRSLCVAWLGGVLLGAVGCEQGPRCFPIQGTVTRAGKPVAGAEVVFQPAQGRPAIGTTNDQGEFSLSTFGDKDGALAGDYRVTIVKNEPVPGPAGDPYARMKNSLPPRYASAPTTPLMAKVEAKAGQSYAFQVD